jgi:hypothetical protein
VGTVKHITVSHQVAFCYPDLVGTVVVWESLAYLSYVPLELFGKVGSHELVECVQIPPADRFGGLVTHCLVLLRRHAWLLLLPNPHSRRVACPE